MADNCSSFHCDCCTHYSHTAGDNAGAITGKGLDKIGHFVAYGAITFLLVLSIKARPSLLSAAILFFVTSALGAVDELTQPLVNRVASPVDWIADIVGISVVLLAFICFNHSNLTTQNAKL